ncbi:hypothetical protein PVW48_18375 [Dinoroseobacter sp. PD6]|uniref:hypothetical protein n=1 Tax=Dinoroseobacter sp. PD6 TaxID=3028384 RepID=UPI00237A30D5|nr:hypothetical protein [Dinoroseobacter sp. PD6]MDD9718732.1 hypothetical protein [Dinoroseobacter sp. PD6]
MPTLFSPTAFEHLLFPLHKTIYAALERAFRQAEEQSPGGLAGAAAFARRTNMLGTLERVDPRRLADVRLPNFDVRLVIPSIGAGKLRKVQEHHIEITPHSDRPTTQYPGAHLVVLVASHSEQRGFVMPLGFALRALEDLTLREGGYQVYQHHLYRSRNPLPFAPQVAGAMPTLSYSALAGTGLVYTGLTGRSWARRFQEHKRSAASGSQTLFHTALRGDFFPIVKTEHEILRAGLDRETAMRVEEVVIEERSLFPIHQQGLNMIPGGAAGMKFLSQFRRSGSLPEPGNCDEAYIDALNEMLRARRAGCAPDATAIARLWAENLTYRIGVTCGRQDRLSQMQITFARIWHASGWSPEKIAHHLDGVDERQANLSQVQRLLAGETYADIPNLLPTDV